jgi:uncharacterized membrane protein YhaH (DUF805 family)
VNWYIQVLQKYAVFSGRARRKEFWMFVLFTILISIGLGIIDAFAGLTTEYGLGILGGIYSLATLIPSLALVFRRLHDTDRTAWWILIGLVPIVGSIVLLVFYCLDGTRGDNRFGSDPKAA